MIKGFTDTARRLTGIKKFAFGVYLREATPGNVGAGGNCWKIDERENNTKKMGGLGHILADISETLSTFGRCIDFHISPKHMPKTINSRLDRIRCFFSTTSSRSRESLFVPAKYSYYFVPYEKCQLEEGKTCSEKERI